MLLEREKRIGAECNGYANAFKPHHFQTAIATIYVEVVSTRCVTQIMG